MTPGYSHQLRLIAVALARFERCYAQGATEGAIGALAEVERRARIMKRWLEQVERSS